MKAAGERRLATKNCRAALVALLSLLVASCSSTSEPSLDLANQSFAASSVAGEADENTAPDTASETVVAQGDAALPEQVAALPTDKVPEDGSAATSAEAPAAPAQAPVAIAAAPAENAAAPKVPAADGPVLENGGPVLTAGSMPAPSIEPKKKSFLSSFFGASPASASPASAALASKPQPKAKPLVALAPAEPAAEPQLSLASLGDSGGGEALPGVRQTSLFEIKHKSGIDDDSDVDLHEDEDGAPVILASAAGFARLAPNGLLKQRESVDVGCLKPSLVRVLKSVERHYGKKMVVTSGYRSPTYNRKVRGARKSQHMYCAAADVQVPGVSKWELAKFVRSMPGRGGVGTYCHTESVHIDVGPERDWNWKCRRRRT